MAIWRNIIISTEEFVERNRMVPAVAREGHVILSWAAVHPGALLLPLGLPANRSFWMEDSLKVPPFF